MQDIPSPIALSNFMGGTVMAIGVALMYVCIPYACVDVLMLDVNLDNLS